jgi:hypothetical protein
MSAHPAFSGITNIDCAAIGAFDLSGHQLPQD